MKFKVLPPARGLDTLRSVREALPLVPGDEESCCLRVTRQTTIVSRDEAKEWLTFCRALGLVEETEAGFRRLREDPDSDRLADRFRAGVYGADEILDTLEAADNPLSAEAVSDRFDIPAWERHRHADPEAVWQTRIARLLEWAVILNLAERVGVRYRSAG